MSRQVQVLNGDNWQKYLQVQISHGFYYIQILHTKSAYVFYLAKTNNDEPNKERKGKVCRHDHKKYQIFGSQNYPKLKKTVTEYHIFKVDYILIYLIISSTEYTV